MKKLTVREVSAIKGTAKNVNSYVVKKNKLAAKIEELTKEYNETLEIIDRWEAAVKFMTDGKTSEDLITKTITDTGKVDANGAPIKSTTYEPKEGVLIYSEEDKCYYINDVVADTTDVVADATPENLNDDIIL